MFFDDIEIGVLMALAQHADENIESNFDAHEKDTKNWMWYGLRSQEQLSEKSNIGAT